MVSSAIVACLLLNGRVGVDPLLEGFRSVPNSSRMRMYWRMFGPAWQRSEIDYQLDLAKQAGLGGLVVYFMYPVALDDPSHGVLNQKFGSPQFLDTFRYAAEGAARRGLRLGVNGGTGWPYGGPTVTPRDAALKLSEVKVAQGKPVPTPSAKERLIAAFEGSRMLAAPPKAGTTAQEELRLFVESPTGQQVKRAAAGGEGPVLNHFDKPAVERWLTANVEPIVSATGGKLDTLGCDSLEVYSANWTRDLPTEFLKRRGYDLLPELALAFDEKNPVGDGVRFDYWRTLMELTEERFAKTLGAWSAAHKLDLEMEAYGTPPNPMTSYRYIQVPTGEHYEWRGFSVQKYVASAAHLTGKNIVGSEAWTWIGLPNRLADTLSDIKLASDMAFLAGTNDLTGVDFPYSPRSAGQPGWQPYYGPTMNQNNPQWVAFPGFVDYASRCQWMLRQGRPKTSVAVYLPVEDCLAQGGMDQMLLDFLVRDHFVTGKATSEFGLKNALTHYSALLRGISAHGFDYDGIDLWAMDRIAKVRGGQLAAGVSSYKTLILPKLDTIELSAARKIRDFCASGGVVVAVGKVPRAPAGRAPDSSKQEFAALMEEVFGKASAPGRHSLGKGAGFLIADDAEVGPFLASAFEPQIRFEMPPETVGFVQRSIRGGEIYFLVNVDSKAAGVTLRLPKHEGSVQVWDAMSGQTWQLSARSDGYFDLSLPPRGSIFLVTGHPAQPPAHVPPHYAKTPEWHPEWSVSFDGPDAPPAFKTDDLRSWTGVPGGRYFSGLGVYRASLDWALEGRPAMLAFDEIHDAARVYVNDRFAGFLWTPPFQIEIGNLLRSGVNEIRVEVGNLPVNRFLGLPDEDLRPLRAKYGARFAAPEEKQLMKEPAPSGLIGHVRILTE